MGWTPPPSTASSHRCGLGLATATTSGTFFTQLEQGDADQSLAGLRDRLSRIASKIGLAAWYLTEETELPDSEIGCTVLVNRPGKAK
jgi:hypothetical protein